MKLLQRGVRHSVLAVEEEEFRIVRRMAEDVARTAGGGGGS